MMHKYGMSFRYENHVEVEEQHLIEFIEIKLADSEPPYYLTEESAEMLKPQQGDLVELSGDDDNFSPVSGEIGMYEDGPAPRVYLHGQYVDLSKGHAKVTEIVCRPRYVAKKNMKVLEYTRLFWPKAEEAGREGV